MKKNSLFIKVLKKKCKNFSPVRLFLFAFICMFSAISYAARVPFDGTGGTTSLAPMLSRVMPSVVNIAVRGEMPVMRLVIPDKDKKPRSVEVAPKFEEVGSGVIIDADRGYIITNAHVVKDAKVITVTLSDGRRMAGKVIGYDVPSDIGVLQINGKRLTALKFGDSDKLKIGDFVCAIGNPFGLQQTVTSGVISGLGRSNLGIEGFEDFIQTDAPINPGNSGGALVDMRGDLIGINTAIITPSQVGGSVGIGLAVPSSMAKSVMDQLIKYGKVKRGVLGVLVQDVTPALASVMHLPSADGALISQVMPGTPAAAAGLKSKDVILQIIDKPIHTSSQVRNYVSLQRVGTKIDIKVLRDNKTITLSAVVADPEELKKNIINAPPKSLLAGMQLLDFHQLVDNEYIRGVEVLAMDDNGIAYSSGVRPRDIILSAGGKPITSIEELRKAVADNPKQVLLEIMRGMGGKLFLVLEE